MSEPLSKAGEISRCGGAAGTPTARQTAGTMLQTFEAVKDAVGLDIPKAIRDVTTGGLVGRATKEAGDADKPAESLPQPETEKAEEANPETTEA